MNDINDTVIQLAWERGRHIVMCGWKDCTRQWVQHSLNYLLCLSLIMQCIKPTILALGCNTVTLSHVTSPRCHVSWGHCVDLDTEPAPFGTILQLHWPERRQRQCQCQRTRDDKLGSSCNKITGSISIMCVLRPIFPCISDSGKSIQVDICFIITSWWLPPMHFMFNLGSPAAAPIWRLPAWTQRRSHVLVQTADTRHQDYDIVHTVGTAASQGRNTRETYQRRLK